MSKDQRNIAIRVALGASSRHTVSRVVGNVVLLTSAGMLSWGELVVVAVILLAVTLLAALGPASRASRVDPAVVLRGQ